MFKKIISLLFFIIPFSGYSVYEIKCIPIAHIDTYHYKTVGAGLCSALSPVKDFQEKQWGEYMQGNYEDVDSVKEEASLYFLIEGKYKHVIVALAKEWDAYYHSKEPLLFDLMYCYTEQEVLEKLEPLSEQEFKNICEELFAFMRCLYDYLPNSYRSLKDVASYYSSAQDITNLL